MTIDISKRRATQKRWRRNVYMREEANRLSHAGEVEPKRGIALVGTAESGKQAPFDDGFFEIWGVGGRRDWMVRADRWYEVHRLAGESETWVENWRAQAKSWNDTIDIYMHYPEPGFGRVIPYPTSHVMDRFGTRFLTSSFSWMMAHAIDELCPDGGEWTPGEIAIYGVDMEAGAEYRQQRAGFHHFIDLARVLNIRVTRLASSGMAYEPVPYPMWQDDPLLNKLDKRQVEARDKLLGFDLAKTKTLTMIAQNAAVVMELSRIGGQDKRISEIETETTELGETLKTIDDDLILWSGIEEEQQFLRDYIT